MDKLQSLNLQHELKFTSEGGLELFKSGKSVWNSGIDLIKKKEPEKVWKYGKPFLYLEKNGSLCIYYGDVSKPESRDSKYAIWNSNSSGPIAILILGNDGNLVAYDKNDNIVWSITTYN